MGRMPSKVLDVMMDLKQFKQCLAPERRGNGRKHWFRPGTNLEFPVGCNYVEGFRCWLRKAGGCLGLEELRVLGSKC